MIMLWEYFLNPVLEYFNKTHLAKTDIKVPEMDHIY